MKFLSYSKESAAIPLLLLGAFFILIPGYLYNTYSERTYDTGNFLAQYLDVTKTIQELEKSIFLPGSGNNPTRAAIFTKLEHVLVETTSNTERLIEAKEGLEHVEILDKQIVSAKGSQHKLEGTVQILEKTVPVYPRESKEAAEYALSLIHTYNESSKEALSYLTYMNNETRSVFTTLIEANGELSDEYITKLNNEIPEAEKAFDSLSFSYKKLIDTRKEIVSQSDRLIKALSQHSQ